MSDPAADRLLSGEAWEDFCETLKDAGRIVEAFSGTAIEQPRAEWYR